MALYIYWDDLGIIYRPDFLKAWLLHKIAQVNIQLFGQTIFYSN